MFRFFYNKLHISRHHSYRFAYIYMKKKKKQEKRLEKQTKYKKINKNIQNTYLISLSSAHFRLAGIEPATS